MEPLSEILKTFIAGFVLGAVFMALRLPIPAPPTAAGIMGIVGIFAGFVFVKRFM